METDKHIEWEKDQYGSYVIHKKAVEELATNTIVDYITDQLQWSQGIGKYADVSTPEKHLSMPFSPSTFRYLIQETMRRLVIAEGKGD